MSLESAIAQILSLAPRSAGHLIRHQDWNTLIASLGELGTAVAAHQADITDLKSEVDKLWQAVNPVVALAGELKGRLDDLEAQVKPLLGNYLVTLSCADDTYAIGEVCELTARVTNLSGDPLAAPFPWVDFVAAWGRLRAKDGFVSRAGAGDNSLSVQVNAQGIAKVQVRADHSEGFSASEESQVDAVMKMQVPGESASVAEAVKRAATPTDQPAKAAYKVLRQEYERKDSKAMRNYADTYHVRTPEWSVAPVASDFHTRWRDYRATVFAFAKPDGDPTTPDGARGTASIQLLFRDWLWPWTWDYLGDLTILEDWVIAEFTPVFQTDDILSQFQKKLDTVYRERGIIGRKRLLEAARKGVGRINPGPEAVKEQIQEAIAAQGASEIYGRGGDSPSVFEAHAGQGRRTEGVKQRVEQVDEQVQGTKGVQAAVDVLEGRMQAAELVGRDIHSNLTLINDNVRAINPLDEASLKANVLRISADIAALKSRLG